MPEDKGYAFRSVNSNPPDGDRRHSGFTISASSSGSTLIRITDMEGWQPKPHGNGHGSAIRGVAAQTLYSFLHVTSASSGDTLDITIESDNAEAFEPKAITHTQFNAIGAEYKTKAGAITDDWFR